MKNLGFNIHNSNDGKTSFDRQVRQAKEYATNALNNEKDLIVNPNMKNLKTTFTQDIKDISEQEKKTAEFLKAKKEKEAKQGLNLSSQNKGNKFGHLKKKEDLER